MTPEKAEKIINDFGGRIANTPDGDRVQDVNQLPCSPGRIKYAYFVYTEALIKEGQFNDDIKSNLGMTYACIDTRFVDDAQKINKAIRLYTKNEKAREYLNSRGGLVAFGIPSVESMTEYHNFVVDCYGNWTQTK